MKSKGTRKVPTNKTNYMSDEAFADIKQALESALAFERGQRRALSVTRIQGSRPSNVSRKNAIKPKAKRIPVVEPAR